MNKNEWQYLVDLRLEVLSIVTGIANAGSYLWWDDTQPNSSTRFRLRGLLESALRGASSFGIYAVTRHNDCGQKNHSKCSDTHGYVWTDPYGLNVSWKDRRFVWDGDQLFQGRVYEPCPCTGNGRSIQRPIIIDFIRSFETDNFVYQAVVRALCDIQSALDEAGDRKPRSGIREYLLRAVLCLNDAIMPTTVETHIASVKFKNIG